MTDIAEDNTNAQPDITLHWFLPTYGDSRGITAGGHGSGFHLTEREADLDYLTQLSLAAESNGFESVLTPTGLWCDDAWITTAALIARTSRLKFLVALRPGLVSPTIIAQQALAFQKLSNNRLLLNVVVGGEDAEQRAFGDHATKEQRYARAKETLDVVNELWTTEDETTYDGEYINIADAKLRALPEVTPPIYFGGSSPAGIDVSAQTANVYLTWGEPVEAAQAKIEKVKEKADSYGRTLDYGIRLHVIARPKSEDAWRVAQDLLDQLDPNEVARIQKGLARSQSEGQRRMTDLHGQGEGFHSGTDAKDLEIAPNLWAGVGLVRGGAGTALVGSYEEVATRIREYQAAGFSHFILSGYPHLEESFHVGEGVIPALQQQGATVKNRPSRNNDNASGVGTSNSASTPFAPLK